MITCKSPTRERTIVVLRNISARFVPILVLCGLGVCGVLAQEATKKEAPILINNRLPNYFNKLDLSEEQRQQIYALQYKYDKEIDALESQLKTLRAKRDAELLTVLTPQQKKLYETTAQHAKNKAAEKAKSKESEKPATPKSAESKKSK